MSLKSENQGYDDRRYGLEDLSRRDNLSDSYDYDYDRGWIRADRDIAREKAEEQEIAEYNRQVEERFRKEHPDIGSGQLSEHGAKCILIFVAAIVLSFLFDCSLISIIAIGIGVVIIFQMVKFISGFKKWIAKIKQEYEKGASEGFVGS